MLQATSLGDLVPIAILGADARPFMQGQLTNDVRRVDAQRAIWGALCSGQGRVQALVTLIERDEGLLGLFPASLVEGLLKRLRAFTLSSKVSFEPAPWAVAQVTSDAGQALFADLPESPGECRRVGGVTLLRWWGSDARYVCVAPPGELQETSGSEAAARDLAWRQSDVRMGLAQVRAETQGMFVPQMLNLDLLSGLSYEKGCYVGQEVVARARRGGVPRRLLGFSASCAPPAPGTVVRGGDADAGQVLDAVGSGSGCDLLAVVELELASGTLELRDIAGSRLVPRPLPYPVPLERS
jgi:tRNA-modifying protein YgfZ